jgi:hypothetical protein
MTSISLLIAISTNFESSSKAKYTSTPIKPLKKLPKSILEPIHSKHPQRTENLVQL